MTNSLNVVAEVFSNTVDSRYLDPSYLDPITYVELISKSRLFSLCIILYFSFAYVELLLCRHFGYLVHHFPSLNIFFTVFTTAYLELGP